jgi:hypothetical protein
VEAPTVTEIRLWSRVDFADLEYEATTDPEKDPLKVLVSRSIDYVMDVTGRTLEDVPTELVTTAQEAIQRRVEQLAYQQQEDHVETAADELISSFGAGSYNERKREVKDLGVQQTKQVNNWHLLHDLLWRLMTEEKREWWEEQITGKNRPAFAVTEVDWQGGDYLGPASDPYLHGA